MKSGVRLPELEMFKGGEKAMTCCESESSSLVKFNSSCEAGYWDGVDGCGTTGVKFCGTTGVRF